MNFCFWRKGKKVGDKEMVQYFSSYPDGSTSTCILREEAVQDALILLERVALEKDGTIVIGEEKAHIINRKVIKKTGDNIVDLAVVRVWKQPRLRP